MQKISVIVPVYNTSKYLSKCLDSLINQTFNNLEIIIVNDCSTDNSNEIINIYLNKYPHLIKYYTNTENKGVAISRNIGVSLSIGEYICFVDSDDFLDINLFENLLPYINRNIDIIKYKANVLNENNNLIEKIDGPIFDITSGEDSFNQLFVKDILMDSACLYLFNSVFFKSNKFNFLPNTYHEDFGLMPLIMVKATTCISTNIYGYNYVSAPQSIMRNSNYEKTLKKAYDLFLHYDNMNKKLPNYNITTQTKKNILSYYSNAILRKIYTLKKEDKKNYTNEIKKRCLINNIQVHNIKQIIKKIILYFLYH